MMGSERSLLLAGSSGLVGSHLLSCILAEEYFSRVHLLLRHPLNIDDDRVHEHLVDFNQLEQWVSQWNKPLTHVFCALGTTIKKAGSKERFRLVDYHFVEVLGRLAQASHCGFSLVSSLGADATSSNFYLRTKGEAEEALKALNLESLALYRPSLMFSGRQELRVGERILGCLGTLISPFLLGGLANYKPIDARLVAEVIYSQAQSNTKGLSIFESVEIRELGKNK